MPYLLLILSTLFWSGNFVLSRGMHSNISPINLSFWRWFIALLILLPFIINKLKPNMEIIKSNFNFLTIQALLGVVGFNTLLYFAVQYTTAINAVLVNSAIPILIAIISFVIFKEKLTKFQIIGILISLFGVIYLMTKGNILSSANLTFNKGDILVLCAAFTWAFYSANLRNYPKGLDPLVYLFMINLIGLNFLFLLYIFDIFYLKNTLNICLPNILTVLYVAIFASVIAFITWNKAVREVGANKAGPFVHLMPVFSTIMAVLFLNEKLMKFHVIGIIFVFTGIALATFQKSMFSKK
jgi:drug/metabolite transporter (DMT)-like permease